MTNGNLAAIDLGTNSCRLMITNQKGNVIFRKTTTTKLGEGLHASGKFTDVAIERGLKCLAEYADIMKEYGVIEYKAIATASCRMAKNGEEFVKAVEELCGIRLDIVDAGEEALLNVKGARINADAGAEYVVVYDLGGGSTEITLATNKDKPEIIYTVSVPWGARNATEAFDLLEYDEEKASKLADEVKKYTRDFLQKSNLEKYREKCEFLATSSTPLRLVSMSHELGEYDRYNVDGVSETIEQLDKQIAKIQRMDFTQMAENPYIGENRAAIFQAACVIFKTIYDELQIKVLKASLKGAQEAMINDLVRKWQI
ncbi:MAG: hypothetical protein IJ677_06885 [Alphaproteobacteria bacterium]|nr:hypothetical protein [Alphaproteobacteria bacterium]